MNMVSLEEFWNFFIVGQFTLHRAHLSERGRGSLAQVLAGLTERDQTRFEGKKE